MTSRLTINTRGQSFELEQGSTPRAKALNSLRALRNIMYIISLSIMLTLNFLSPKLSKNTLIKASIRLYL